ncbi:MAG TPA: GNAT family N-acetyltransferase [candidate division Zixibacteria bacterium]|nr:GNAT family N-acetyltransferase [candidate division Zixibacteria bacterium]
MPHELHTDRLLLRRWRESDYAPFAAMNADPRVMKHFPGLLTREQSDALIDRIENSFEKRGYGLWAVEISAAREFAGFVGLSVPRFEAHFTPCVEIGWRLAAEHWGHGYATEGARRVLEFAFTEAGLEDLVSFTVPANKASIRVMEKIGMSRDPAEDFDHPSLAPASPLRRHVLYRLSHEEWVKISRSL